MKLFFVNTGLLLVFFSVAVFGGERELDCNKIFSGMRAAEEGFVLDSYDSSGDGETDFFKKTDKDGNKVAESIDFNHDGIMDDFYYYDDGIISLREVDSNFDKKIDVWVYIKEGKYIVKYERDLDYDGIIDQVKTFGDES